MNKINRSLVKSQAKQIIKEKIFALFVLSAIVLFLVNGLTVGISAYNSRGDLEDIFGPSNGSSDNSSGQNTPEDFFNYFGNGDYDYDDGNNSGDSSSDNPIESFGQKYTPSSKIIGSSSKPTTMLVNGNISLEDIGLKSLTVVSVILSPLFVSLCGFYVLLVKRDPNEQLGLGKEIQNLFRISFGPTYGNKIVIYILRGVFEFLWSLLFVIPGIVYHYSSYFAFQLMCENPNLKPTEALKLSKKMVAGNRGELFALDLSFIGWWLLTGITFGIASIYVIPYYFTTQALYYENFKLRALQEGKITEDDFLSQEQRAAKYAFAGAQNENKNYAEGNNQSNYYYNPNNCDNTQSAAQNETAQNQNAAPFYSYNPNGVPTEQEPVQSGSYPSYANTDDTAAANDSAPSEEVNSEEVNGEKVNGEKVNGEKVNGEVDEYYHPTVQAPEANDEISSVDVQDNENEQQPLDENTDINE